MGMENYTRQNSKTKVFLFTAFSYKNMAQRMKNNLLFCKFLIHRFQIYLEKIYDNTYFCSM